MKTDNIKFIVNIDNLPELRNYYKGYPHTGHVYEAIIELLNRVVYETDCVSLEVNSSLITELYKSLGFIIRFINERVNLDDYEFINCETLTNYSVILTLGKRQCSKKLYPIHDDNLLSGHPDGLGKHIGVFNILDIDLLSLEETIRGYYDSYYLPLFIEDCDEHSIIGKYLMVISSDIHNKSFERIPTLDALEIIVSGCNYYIKEVLKYLKFSDEHAVVSVIGIPNSTDK